MANPNTYEARSPDIGTTTVHVEFVLGSSGAVGAINRKKELRATTPIVKETAAGTYTVYFKEGWVKLLNCSGMIHQATYSTAAGINFNLKVNSITAATPLVTVEFRDVAGAVANGASGDIVKLSFELQQVSP